MTQTDYSEFSSEIRRLGTVFRLRTSPAELAQLTDAYFAALQRFTILQIITACEQWTAKETKFPKPAELAVMAPRRAVETPTLDESHAAEWTQAELARWERAPCQCRECVTAGVHEKPLRFVPEVDAQDRDRMVKLGDKLVVAGHWAHGPELAGWYRARADFYNRCMELGLRGDVLKPKARLKRTVKERIEAAFWKDQGAPPEAV